MNPDCPEENKLPLMDLSNPYFCMAAWSGINIHPSGRVHPCCVYDFDSPLGNIHESSIRDIRNAEPVRKLRSNMMAGKESPGCRQCYAAERAGAQTQRTHINSLSSQFKSDCIGTAPDGSIDLSQVPVRYLSIQFSNVCNFKCRMCNAIYSSSWISDAQELEPGKSYSLNILEKSAAGFWEQLEEHVSTIDEVYFWGGEPVLMEEHYKFLELLISHNNRNVKIRYNTNFSRLNFKNWDLCSLWSEFSNVRVYASLDAMGDRAEMIRKGTKWAQIEKNREHMIRYAPQVGFEVACTTGAMNIWHISDFHKDWVSKGLINLDAFCINFLQFPEFFNCQILPEQMKVRVREKIQAHIETFIRGSNYSTTGEVEKRFLAILNYMDEQSLTDQIPEFLRYTEKLDHLRHENFWNVFPELLSLKDYAMITSDKPSEI